MAITVATTETVQIQLIINVQEAGELRDILNVLQDAGYTINDEKEANKSKLTPFSSNKSCEKD